ncbi:MAG TPA: ABC transporter permease [Verrucomicrobiae bacterium]|jgi:lipoprotein-releasing system permease protein
MSKLPFELMLALRYLRPKRTFVSIITLISVVGVALGVAVLIIVISVMSGFDHDLRQKLIGFNANLTLTEHGTTMANYQAIMAEVSSNKNVRGVAPFVLGQVLVETEPADTNAEDSLTAAPYLRGVDPAVEGSVSVLPGSIRFGQTNLAVALQGQGVVIGEGFAETMRLSVGDRMAIYSPNDIKKMRTARSKKDIEAILPDDYTVTGIFDVGYYDFDSDFIVTSLENAQDLYNLDDNVHGLMVMLNDPYQVDPVRDELQQSLGSNFSMSTWMEDNSAFLSALVVEKNMMFYLLFFIVLVAALCILSAQITFVVQKTREIGMLKAIGATNLQISGIFLAQSAIIGVLGVLAGLGFGILAVTYRNDFLDFMRHATGWELFPESIYKFTQLPAVLDSHDIAIICGLSFIICILGGVLPAIRAGRLQPVEALRNE